MADPATFGHDRLGHLLSDTLLTVPKFQRRYSWQEEHVADYWDDIARARRTGNAYFMGTVVLANDSAATDRKLIVDGQQRISTTAILLAAVRDRLFELTKDDAARSVESNHLSSYVLAEEATVSKLTLSPSDISTYEAILNGNLDDETGDLAAAYRQLKQLVDELAPDELRYRELIDLVTYLDESVQVLLAVATGIGEAYVIFETLNDRGADLTTADLLKNYLFSKANPSDIGHAEEAWTRLTAQFEKSTDFVKFLRYEYMSRCGHVTSKNLYQAIQLDLGQSSSVRHYLDRVEKSLKIYLALREPDDPSWSPQAIEVKDSLLAFRRFGFESSTPLLLAAFTAWTHTEATRFVDTVASWSVRAWFAGKIGGGVAEKAFCDAAAAITSNAATTPADLFPKMKTLVPSDLAFKDAIKNYGPMTTTKAKYLLSQLDAAFLAQQGESTDARLDWSSKSVTVEHIFAKSMKEADFENVDDFEAFETLRDQLANLTLLERTLNSNLDDKPNAEKLSTYTQSNFALTREIGNAEVESWSFKDADARIEELADLAVKAWPL